MPDPETNRLSHFEELARAGNTRPGVCSSGEARAAQLANVVIACAPNLDDAAIEGLIHFIRFAWRYPNRAREVIQ